MSNFLIALGNNRMFQKNLNFLFFNIVNRNVDVDGDQSTDTNTNEQHQISIEQVWTLFGLYCGCIILPIIAFIVECLIRLLSLHDN